MAKLYCFAQSHEPCASFLSCFVLAPDHPDLAVRTFQRHFLGTVPTQPEQFPLGTLGRSFRGRFTSTFSAESEFVDPALAEVLEVGPATWISAFGNHRRMF